MIPAQKEQYLQTAFFSSGVQSPADFPTASAGFRLIQGIFRAIEPALKKAW
jgi:hypothetical protein